MTRNRRLKTEIRTHQATTGVRYSVARRQLTPPTLAEVMHEHPLLNDFGIGVFHSGGKTLAERRSELAAGRARLADREAIVLDTVTWLRDNITPIKTPTVSSYSMKHVMERAIGVYTTNGEFIAAALIAGYPFKYTEGPNVLLAMSARDIKRTKAAAR